MKTKIFIPLLAIFVLLMSSGSQAVYADTPGKAIELLLNEGSGVIVSDSSGNGNDANINGATWVELPTGKWALNFNGNGNSLICDYSPSLDISGPTAEVTLEAWVSMNQDKSAMWIGTGSGGSIGGYALYYHQPLGTVCGYIENAEGWHAIVYAGTSPGVNVWHHVVYTYDGQRGRIYIDGNPQGSSDPWTGGMFPTSNPFQVYSQFAGMIGKIAVYNYALSLDQIEDIYQAESWNYHDTPTNTTIYVYPALTDNKVLPLTIIPSEYISNNIYVNGSPGEYRPASFVIYAPNSISSVTATVSDLTGPGGIISSSSVDIRVVKNWFQAGLNIYDVNGEVLTPELLLKDDSLVKVENGENYVKLSDGSYEWISDPTQSTQEIALIPIADMPIEDSDTLQPVDIPAGTNKQFWITVKIPNNASAGNYIGTITLASLSGNVGQVQLNLEVLPINLSETYLTYSIYYRSYLTTIGTISSDEKNQQQLTAELINMLEHGVTNPTVYDQGSDANLGQVLNIRNHIGIDNRILYYLGLGITYYGSNLESLINAVTNLKNFVSPYGVTELYIYAPDEQNLNNPANRAQIDAVHQVGVKVFDAQRYSYADAIADVLDLAVVSLTPDASLAQKYHSYNHKIFSYDNPQCGMELPETYRRNFGLLLWQQDYDGAMDYAYQHGFGNIWNDFDDSNYRDHVMAYPTMDGVIDTIQWEGFREGVNDMRYLTTLLDTIQEAKAAGEDTSTAETWLANLKSSDLTTRNLDVVRSQMIDHILSLQNEPQNQPPVLNPIGDKEVNEGELLTFTISATDPDGDNLTYSASNLPSGATFNATTQTFSWIPDEAGTYPNIHFEVSDGEFTDSEDITITVNEASPVEPNPEPPYPFMLQLDNLSITPGEVDIGEEITISVLVTNVGDAAGSCFIMLEINGVTEATKEITVDAGATEEVSFTIIKNNAGIYVVDVNGLSASFIVKEAPTTIVEEAPATEISVFSVTPSYDTETHRLAFARIIYEVNNLHQPTTDVELTLKVSLDGEPVEELSLLPPSWLDSDRITDSRDYIPPEGWRSGTYTFQVELSVGGELYATTIEELEVTAASATPIFSWAILGEIIGATLILIAATVSAILLRRRHLLRRLGQR